GNVRATRELRFLSGTPPVALGAETYTVRRTAKAFQLFRSNAAEESMLVLRVPLDRVLPRTGKAENARVHVSPAGIVLEIRGPYQAVYLDAARGDRLFQPDPALECGGSASYATVFPARSGGISRVTSSGGRPDDYVPARGAPRLERLDEKGRLLAS